MPNTVLPIRSLACSGRIRRATNPAFRLALSVALSVALPFAVLAQTPETKQGPTSPTSIAIGQVNSANPVKIVFAGKPLPTPSPATAPYRDPADKHLCITPEMLEPLGIVYVLDSEHGKVTLTTTNGSAVTTIETRTPPADSPQSTHKGVFIPAIEVLTALGGKCEFEVPTNTLYVRSVLTGVELLGGQLRISATFPVLPTITRDETGKTVILDFPGTEVGKLPKTLDLNAPHVSQARTGQFESDIARVVLEFKQPSGFIVLGGKADTNLVLNPIPVEGLKVSPTATSKASTKTASRKTAKGKKTPAPIAPAMVNKVEFRPLSDDRAQFVLRAERATAIRASQGKGQLILDLANAVVGPNASDDLGEVKHPFLRAATLLARDGKTARLAVDLTRIVTFTVKPDGQGNILLDLFMPKNAGGRLAGKLVVVDAGHGDHDKGAPGVNGTWEKNVNLAIATQLGEQLREAGANVIMTRSNDFFIPVNDRARIANSAGADFFISVHANDPGNGNRNFNGSVVYYHAKDIHCRALAQCVAERFETMGGIRSKGIASDYTLYSTGLGVLRTSRMVAILVETGFMTNPSDVKNLNNSAMQRKIAGSILLGLKDYIEGNPDFDTRSINPEADGGRLNMPLDVPSTPDMPTAGMPDAPENPDPTSEAPSEPAPSQPGQ